jgi:hypothetical protein
MKRQEPEFDQWTDQNHLPYYPHFSTESHEITSSGSFRKGFNLLWHGVLKLFKHSQTLGVHKKQTSRAFLSWPRS